MLRCVSREGLQRWFNGFALRASALGVGAAAVYSEAKTEAAKFVATAQKGFNTFCDQQGKDGGAFEGHVYGEYAVDFMVMAAEALRRIPGEPHLFNHPWLQSLPLFAGSSLASDNRTLANFGDSDYALLWRSTMFALAFHGNAMAQWYLETTMMSNGAYRFSVHGSPLIFSTKHYAVDPKMRV